MNEVNLNYKLTTQMAGYSGTPIIRKLGIKEDFSLAHIHPIQGLGALLDPLPPGATWASQMDPESLDFVIGFAQTMHQLDEILILAYPAIKKNGMVWICWPKGKSKLHSDINREDVREAGLNAGLVDIKVAAIDEDWSGLKFVFRTKDR